MLSAPTVLAASLLGLGLGIASWAVAARLVRRGRDESRLGWSLLATFWGGMAAYVLLDSTWAIGVVLDVVPVPVAVTVLHLKVVSATLGFFGLVAYLLLVYTGRRGSVRLVAAAYVGIYLLTLYYYTWRDPIGQHVGNWGASLDYAREGGAFQDIVVLLLFVPPCLSAIAYAFLLRHVRDRESRIRVTTMSVSLIVLFAGLTMGWLNGRLPWWGLAEKLLALSAVVALVFALHHGRATAP